MIRTFIRINELFVDSHINLPARHRLWLSQEAGG